MAVSKLRSALYYAEEIDTALHRALTPSELARALAVARGEAPDQHQLLDFGDVMALRESIDNVLARLGVKVPRARNASTGEPVLGWDVTLAAPKSMSLAMAYSPLADAVQEAHGRGVEVATEWLVKHAARGRKRLPDGDRVAVPITPLALVEVRHLRNRLDEPHLHSHVLWWRDGLDADGKRRALHSPWLYRNHEPARQIALAVARRALYLADPEHVRFVRDLNGNLQLAGVPDSLLAAVSRRDEAVSQETARRLGALSPDEARAERPGLFWRMRQRAVVATRSRKRFLTPDELRSHWSRIAPEDRVALLWPSIEEAAKSLTVDDIIDDLDRFAEQVRNELAMKPTFTREDLTAAVARSAVYGLPPDPLAIDELVDTVADRLEIRLVAPELDPASELVEAIPELATSRNPILTKLRDRFALPEILDAEQRVLAWFDTPTTLPAIPQDVLARTLAKHSWLTDEQRRAVEVAALGTRTATLIRGRAGAGKTAAMQVLAEAARLAGFDVIAIGYTGRAAVELKRAGIGTASTIDSWLMRYHIGGQAISRPTIVLIDEASVVPTHTFDELRDALKDAPVRVVAVGDHRQFSAVEAGGLFTAAWHGRRQRDDRDIALLARNMRQRDPHLRKVVAALERGSPERALALLQTSGDLILDDDAARLAGRTLAVWLAERDRGTEVVMLTVTREHATELSLLAHQLLVERKELGDKALHLPESRLYPDVPEREYRVGERIVLLNTQDLRRADTVYHATERVPTSTVLTVEALTPSGGVHARVEGTNELVYVPYTVLRDHTTLAWAITTYRSQGDTVGTAERRGVTILYRPEAADARLGWVAATRPRDRLVLAVLGKDEETVLDTITGTKQIVSTADNPPIPLDHAKVQDDALTPQIELDDAPTVAAALTPALQRLADRLKPAAVLSDAAAIEQRAMLERSLYLALAVPHPVLVGLTESLDQLAAKIPNLSEDLEASPDPYMVRLLDKMRDRLQNTEKPRPDQVQVLAELATLIDALAKDDANTAFAAFQVLAEDVLGTQEWRRVARYLITNETEAIRLALQLISTLLDQGVGLLTAELGYEWPREHAMYKLAAELAGHTLTWEGAQAIGALLGMDANTIRDTFVTRLVIERTMGPLPTMADLAAHVVQMAADLNEAGAELDVDYIDESDVLTPDEFDFEDELPIDSWQPSDEANSEPRMAAKPEPITPRPPWTLEHDARTVQRLQLLGPEVVRAMYVELQRSNPTATLATLFAQLENPYAPVWDLDVARARLVELMDSGRTADLAFELFPLLQIQIAQQLAEQFEPPTLPATYELNQHFDLSPGIAPDEPPDPEFGPGVPKM